MNMGEFFDSLSNYSFEDMQRKARMKEDEKAAAKSNGDEPKSIEKTTVKVEGDGDELSKYVNRWMTPDEFSKQAGKVAEWRKKKADMSQDDPIGFPEHTYYRFGDPGVVSHSDFVGINGLKEKIAAAGGDPAAVDEVLFNHFKEQGLHTASSGDDILLQDDTAYGPNASILVSPKDIEEFIKVSSEGDKSPEGEKSPEEIAKHVSEKIRATSEFMEPEEFNKLLMGEASSDGGKDDDEEETSESDSSKSQGSKEWAEDLLHDCKQELSRIESSGEEGKAAAEKLGVVDFYKSKIAALEKELADGSYGEKSSTDLPPVVLSDENVKKEC